MRPVRLVAAAIVLAGIGVAAWVLTHRGLSEQVLGPWDRLGGQRWLLPDLDEAEVVVIDRPHSKAESPLARRGLATIRRTRTYLLSTNADRLRNPPIGAKPAGRWRMVAIGDSVTHGWGLTEAESWPRQLETLLRARGRDVEVINAGMPSADAKLMAAWCTAEGPRFDIDEVLWSRRPAGPGGVSAYVELARSCARTLGARLTVVLPPVSTFDAHGGEEYAEEDRQVQATLPDATVIALTDPFRAAQAGHGEVMVHRGDRAVVLDQESGKVWLESPWSRGDVTPEVGALFEAEPDVREALFFDEGHPDAEGAALMARTIADRLAP